MNEFQHPLRIYIEDTDAGGIVYYVNYLKFFERARTEWWRHRRQPDLGQDTSAIQFVVRRAEVDYRAPARLDDAVIATADCVEAHGARLVFRQRLLRDTLELATATIEVACVDRLTLKPRRLPAALRAAPTDDQPFEHTAEGAPRND